MALSFEEWYTRNAHDLEQMVHLLSSSAYTERDKQQRLVSMLRVVFFAGYRRGHAAVLDAQRAAATRGDFY